MDILHCPVVNVFGRRYRVQGGGLAQSKEDIPSQENHVIGVEEDEVTVSKISQENDAYVTRISADKEVTHAEISSMLSLPEYNVHF